MADEQGPASYAFYSQGLEGLLPGGSPLTIADMGQTVSVEFKNELLSMPVESIETTPAGAQLTLQLRARHDIFIDAMLDSKSVKILMLGRQLTATIDKVDLKRGFESVRLTILKD